MNFLEEFFKYLTYAILFMILAPVFLAIITIAVSLIL